MIAFSSLISFILIIQVAFGMPNAEKQIKKADLNELRKRSSLNPSERTLDCFDMVGIEGDYVHTPNDRNRQCTVYFIANRMDEFVEFRIRQIDIACSSNRLQYGNVTGTSTLFNMNGELNNCYPADVTVKKYILQIFDGWKLGGAVFPSPEEHEYSMDNRHYEACGKDFDSVFLSSQNVAMLSFQSNSGHFKISFRTRKNPRPCHAMAPDSTGEYDLQNYGERRNCTFSVIYPVKISVIQMSVGDPTQETKLKCFNEQDQLQFLEGNGLDYALMRTEQVLCGSTEMVDEIQEYESLPRESNDTSVAVVCKRVGLSIPLQCQSSTVRLISSGETDNQVRIKFSKITSSVNECL